MKRGYRLPIMGGVKDDNPLTGVKGNPLEVIPLNKLEGYDELGDKKGFSLTCINYNIDEEWCEVELEASEEFHSWLADILPQLRDIQKARGWKLDKSKLGKK